MQPGIPMPQTGAQVPVLGVGVAPAKAPGQADEQFAGMLSLMGLKLETVPEMGKPGSGDTLAQDAALSAAMASVMAPPFSPQVPAVPEESKDPAVNAETGTGSGQPTAQAVVPQAAAAGEIPVAVAAPAEVREISVAVAAPAEVREISVAVAAPAEAGGDLIAAKTLLVATDGATKPGEAPGKEPASPKATEVPAAKPIPAVGEGAGKTLVPVPRTGGPTSVVEGLPTAEGVAMVAPERKEAVPVVPGPDSDSGSIGRLRIHGEKGGDRLQAGVLKNEVAHRVAGNEGDGRDRLLASVLKNGRPGSETVARESGTYTDPRLRPVPEGPAQLSGKAIETRAGADVPPPAGAPKSTVENSPEAAVAPHKIAVKAAATVEQDTARPVEPAGHEAGKGGETAAPEKPEKTGHARPHETKAQAVVDHPAPQAHAEGPKGHVAAAPRKTAVAGEDSHRASVEAVRKFGGPSHTGSVRHAPVFRQIVAGLQLEGAESRVKIQLAPEHLGKVEVMLAGRDNRLEVRIVADNPRAADALQSQLQDLSRGIREKAPHFQHLDVQVEVRDAGRVKADEQPQDRREQQRQQERQENGAREDGRQRRRNRERDFAPGNMWSDGSWTQAKEEG